jgi:DNA replication protein DnaC
MLTMLERTKLLIIDDWGPEPLSAEQRRDLLEIVDDRYEKGSLLITSQVPVSRWHELMGDPTIGDAILDRVVHRAHRLELTHLIHRIAAIRWRVSCKALIAFTELGVKAIQFT